MQNENGPTPFDGDVVEHTPAAESETGKTDTGKTGGGEDEEVNIELKWHKEVLKCGDYAVYSDTEGFPILYSWVKTQNRWAVVKGDHFIDKHVRSFILGKHRGNYKNAKIRACVDSTTNIVYGSGKHLVKETERSMIDTRNHVLEVTQSGQVVRHEKHPKAAKLYRNFVDIGLKFSDFDEKSGYYTPRPQEEIEASTLWGKLVTDCFPVERDRRVFQEFMGDLFCPTLRKAFPVLLGEKDSGKSQILEVIAGVLTDAKAGDLSNLSGFQMAPFIGCSTIIVDEFGKRIDEKMTKKMVGGSLISVERKYKDAITIKPDYKCIGSLNEMFTVTEKSGALESRFYILPVKKHNGTKIDEIGKKICEGYIEHRQGVSVMHASETKDVMDWAIQGLQRVMIRGRMLRQEELSGEAQAMMDGMRKESNPALDFIEEYGIIPSGGASFVPKSEVYSLFTAWAEERGRSGLARISINVWARDMFKAAMVATHGESYDISSDTRKTVTTTKGKRRVDCFAIRITGSTDVKHIDEEVCYVSTSAPVATAPNMPTNIVKLPTASKGPADSAHELDADTAADKGYWHMDSPV